MKLASLITVYWYKRLDIADHVINTSFSIKNVFPRLKWTFLWVILEIIARLYGYHSARNLAFIHHCLEGGMNK